jgi:cysteine desulfurase
LDLAGVCCSAGSACTRSTKQDFSKVLTAMGRSAEEGAFLRFSVGRTTTDIEIETAAQRFAQCVADLNEVF